MNKVTVLGLVGAIAATVAPADVSYAQGKAGYPLATVSSAPTQPIKFGDGRTLTYEINQEIPNGTVYYFPDGSFKLKGFLDGFRFVYLHEHGPNETVVKDVLTLIKNGVEVQLHNIPPENRDLKDYAVIDGATVPFDGPDFYEKPLSRLPYDKPTMNDRLSREKLHGFFSEWTKKLNIGAVKREAERLKTPKEKLLKSLEVLVK